MDHIWTMVDQDGAQRVFQLVEAGTASEASRLVKELHLGVVMIEVALPSAIQLEAMSVPGSGSARAKLIVVNVHTGNDGDAAGLVAHHKNVESEPMATLLPLV